MSPTQCNERIASNTKGNAADGLGIWLLAFGITSVIKFAQGSSTAAMIVSAAMLGAILGSTAMVVTLFLASVFPLR